MLRLYGAGRRRTVEERNGAAGEGGGEGAAAAAGGAAAAAPAAAAAAAPAAAAAAAAAAAGPRILASDIRLQKDLEDLDLPPNCTLLSVPAEAAAAAAAAAAANESQPAAAAAAAAAAATMQTFLLTFKPDEGFWKGGRIRFEIRLPHNYPHEPPKVKCKDKARV
ncbi:ubiquitin-conjugating enzyme e2, putative [Eimeria brunetti]|uniref:Ubiquitin-conjugating enzyme e2, putative n=1 Tax=Eimeria brunetti TaxID=51314 RepID=U6LMP7_9EIME|nr:ubiquitin-conjugating enzyme e2, putative [Eimeria brunetti]